MMDMFDEARAMRATMELCKISQRELAIRLGVSQSYVANKLRLLSLDDDEVALVRELGLTERHVRAALPLTKDVRLEVLGDVGRRGLSVRECEALVSSRKMRSEAPTFSRRWGVSLIRDAEEAMRKITESLTEVGVEARLRTTIIEGATYMTIRITNP